MRTLAAVVGGSRVRAAARAPDLVAEDSGSAVEDSDLAAEGSDREARAVRRVAAGWGSLARPAGDLEAGEDTAGFRKCTIDCGRESMHES
jgi:hypothetical protein